jgi:hypothetical protein
VSRKRPRADTCAMSILECCTCGQRFEVVRGCEYLLICESKQWKVIGDRWLIPAVSAVAPQSCHETRLASRISFLLLASLYVGRQELERSVEWMSIMANLPCKLLRLPSIMLQSHH